MITRRIFRRYRTKKRGGQHYWVGRKLRRNFGSFSDDEFYFASPDIKRKIIQTQIDKIQRGIEESARHPDNEGFIFLTNSEKMGPLPIDFAKQQGFTSPVFKIKKPEPLKWEPRPPNISPETLKIMDKNRLESNKWHEDTMEGVWVKDRFKGK